MRNYHDSAMPRGTHLGPSWEEFMRECGGANPSSPRAPREYRIVRCSGSGAVRNKNEIR